MSRILIVEDESIAMLNMAFTLMDAGHTVAGTASSGKEAIELAELIHPDVVLMDVHLAGDMDGIEAAGVICQSGTVPCIFVTAAADEVRRHLA